MEIAVSRKAHFNAAHRLHVAAWSEDENKRFFGLCNNPNFHGHNYNLTVTVIGEVDPVSGYLIDTKWLSQLIKLEIEDRFDHKNLNIDCPEFAQMNPTAEHIAIVIWRILRDKIEEKIKLKVVLYETERNFVEYNGN